MQQFFSTYYANRLLLLNCLSRDLRLEIHCALVQQLLPQTNPTYDTYNIIFRRELRERTERRRIICACVLSAFLIKAKAINGVVIVNVIMKGVRKTDIVVTKELL